MNKYILNEYNSEIILLDNICRIIEDNFNLYCE